MKVAVVVQKKLKNKNFKCLACPQVDKMLQLQTQILVTKALQNTTLLKMLDTMWCLTGIKIVSRLTAQTSWSAMMEPTPTTLNLFSHSATTLMETTNPNCALSTECTLVLQERDAKSMLK